MPTRIAKPHDAGKRTQVYMMLMGSSQQLSRHLELMRFGQDPTQPPILKTMATEIKLGYVAFQVDVHFQRSKLIEFCSLIQSENDLLDLHLVGCSLTYRPLVPPLLLLFTIR